MSIAHPWFDPKSVVEKFHATWARNQAREDPDNASMWHDHARSAEKNAARYSRWGQ
jgi:hypothetical protein